MAASFKVKRRINGSPGSPSTIGAKEGELAVNAPGPAGSTTKPDLWFFDGGGWRNVNPDVEVTTQSIDLGTAHATIGQAFTAWDAIGGNDLTGNLIIAKFGTPSQVFMLTDPVSPGIDTSWTSLGASTEFASTAEVLDGVSTIKAISPASLRGASTQSGGAPADAKKVVLLDSTGKISSTMLPAMATHMSGAIDPTVPAPSDAQAGAIYFARVSGVADPSFTGIGGTAIEISDALLFDGATWSHIPNIPNLNAYLPLAGTNNMSGPIVYAGAANSKLGQVIYDGKGGTLDNVVLDGGAF